MNRREFVAAVAVSPSGAATAVGDQRSAGPPATVSAQASYDHTARHGDPGSFDGAAKFGLPDRGRCTGVKALVLTHLLAQIDQPGIREQIVHEIQQVFEGKVIWGEDLMRLGLSGARVSTIEPGQHE